MSGNLLVLAEAYPSNPEGYEEPNCLGCQMWNLCAGPAKVLYNVVETTEEPLTPEGEFSFPDLRATHQNYDYFEEDMKVFVETVLNELEAGENEELTALVKDMAEFTVKVRNGEIS